MLVDQPQTLALARRQQLDRILRRVAAIGHGPGSKARREDFVQVSAP
jgi:hypothetical protein